ncbi:progestin and adipoQ receptor family member 4-like [Centruroides sculpturatus]|uniref:progestin and adipoQ receptor family member 4-like n=1 Tax=Centruroides sculpturatus TaxID=218467 RepID=UPI000C6EFC72|nr:progestin and adipoQ receptor family member 4-like [Centruroides sculpturatus]
MAFTMKRFVNEHENNLENNEKKQKDPQYLLRVDEVPNYLQFNRFVLDGYRPQMTFWECLRSLTYLHNETINVLSHGIPLIYAVWKVPELLPQQFNEMPIIPYLHIAAIIAPWLGSSVYHLFMNHISGSKTYSRLLQWDVVGVWVTQSCGGLTTIYTGVSCLPYILQLVFLGIYVCFCLRALQVAVFACGPWQRRQSFAILFLIRMVVLILRMTPYGGGHPEAIYHVIMQDLLSLIGAVISAVRIPERWLPGRFDYIFNSHNIMHVIVVIGAVHMHWAVEKDIGWMIKRVAQRSLNGH